MTVLALLVSLAVPSLFTFINNNRLQAQTDELVTALNVARSEAAVRRQTAGVCSTTDGVNCANDAWDQGWMVWLDTNGDGLPGPPPTEILRVSIYGAGLPAAQRVTVTAGPLLSGPVLFNSAGIANTGGVETLTVSKSGAQVINTISLTPFGQITVTESVP